MTKFQEATKNDVLTDFEWQGNRSNITLTYKKQGNKHYSSNFV